MNEYEGKKIPSNVIEGARKEIERQDEIAAVEGIRRGLEQMQRGEGRPAGEVFAEFRRKHNLPND